MRESWRWRYYDLRCETSDKCAHATQSALRSLSEGIHDLKHYRALFDQPTLHDGREEAIRSLLAPCRRLIWDEVSAGEARMQGERPSEIR